MGWRDRFDPSRLGIDQLRERTRRLRDIRALGDQVARVRRVGLRTEILVPVIAILILAAAVGLSALSPAKTPVTAPTIIAERPGTPTAGPSTGGAAASGYPAPTTTPFDSSTTTASAEPTGVVTSTTAMTNTAIAGVPSGTGYPGAGEGPQVVDPAPNNNVPPPLPTAPAPPAQGGRQPYPTPNLIPTTPPPSNGSGGGSYPGPQTPPSTPRPAQPQPTQGAAPTPEQGTPAAPDVTTVPGSANATPTSATTPTPIPTEVLPTPTARPAEVLSGNLRWTIAQSPVVLNKDQVLASGASLIIDPGVEVQLGPDVQFRVAGTLRAQGSPSAPVRMTGTNGRWNGLVGTSGSAIVLDNVQLRQAGSAGTALSSTGGALVVRNSLLTGNGGGIVTIGSALEVRNTQIVGNAINGPVINVQLPNQNSTTIVGATIRDNATPGGAAQVSLSGIDGAGPLAIDGNSITGGAGLGILVNTSVALQGTIRCNALVGGTIGLQLSAKRPDTAGFNLAIDNNSFTGQVRYGAAGTLAFNLANNWWSDPSGPADARRNAQGRGVPIGVNLQFQPWLTTRPACAPPQ